MKALLAIALSLVLAAGQTLFAVNARPPAVKVAERCLHCACGCCSCGPGCCANKTPSDPAALPVTAVPFHSGLDNVALFFAGPVLRAPPFVLDQSLPATIPAVCSSVSVPLFVRNHTLLI